MAALRRARVRQGPSKPVLRAQSAPPGMAHSAAPVERRLEPK